MVRILVSNENILEKIAYINKNFKSLILLDNHKREKKMIDIIFKKINQKDLMGDKNNLLSLMLDAESEDTDIISYNTWVKENIK